MKLLQRFRAAPSRGLKMLAAAKTLVIVPAGSNDMREALKGIHEATPGLCRRRIRPSRLLHPSLRDITVFNDDRSLTVAGGVMSLLCDHEMYQRLGLVGRPVGERSRDRNGIHVVEVRIDDSMTEKQRARATTCLDRVFDADMDVWVVGGDGSVTRDGWVAAGGSPDVGDLKARSNFVASERAMRMLFTRGSWVEWAGLVIVGSWRLDPADAVDGYVCGTDSPLLPEDDESCYGQNAMVTDDADGKQGQHTICIVSMEARAPSLPYSVADWARKTVTSRDCAWVIIAAWAADGGCFMGLIGSPSSSSEGGSDVAEEWVSVPWNGHDIIL